jgi:hypothetical protein
MQIQVEPNLDVPIPVTAQPQFGQTHEERIKIAGNTALILQELGFDPEVTPEEQEKAREMFASMKPGEKNTKPSKEEKSELSPGVAKELSKYISEYERQIVQDKVQVRTIVMNRLMQISQDEDNKTALKALELLGKASDLFTDRSEVTITHQTSDELKIAIKERIAQLMQTQKIDVKTKTESRLAHLQTEEAVDIEAKEVK